MAFASARATEVVITAEKPWDLSDLETLAIEHNGRVKPFYTFAVETLQAIHGASVYKPRDSRPPISAMDFVLSFWLSDSTDPAYADRVGFWESQPIILIQNIELKRKLGLDVARKHFSLQELMKHPALMQEGDHLPTDWPEPLKRAARQTQERVEILWRLVHAREVSSGAMSPFRVVLSEDGSEWKPVESLNQALAEGKGFAVQKIPKNYYFINQDLGEDRSSVILNAFTCLKEEYQGTSKRIYCDVSGFEIASGDFAAALRAAHPEGYPSMRALQLEVAYMKWHPFRMAWISYLVAALVLALSGLAPRLKKPGYLLGWGLVLIGFLWQCAGFACRVYLSGRPPVTNMYETVIWVAFGAVFFAIMLEWIYKSRTLLFAASIVAVVSLILADNQPAILDPSIRPLVPVLRSNFWLTIHVLTITLSYAAFALALVLGHIILVRHAFELRKSRTDAQCISKEAEGAVCTKQTGGTELGCEAPITSSGNWLAHNYLYRTLQVGVFLLATGTMLGAVWANYSWGRFWDWDPKETWALIALLCYLIVLHGRILGWWNGIGLAVGAILGFLSVLMAWYGVNFILGQGLHSYGFGVGGQTWVYAFVALELIFVCATLAAIRYMKRGKPHSVSNGPE